jgi:hypothetical protein
MVDDFIVFELNIQACMQCMPSEASVCVARKGQNSLCEHCVKKRIER